MVRSISEIERELMALPELDRGRIAYDLVSLDKGEEPLSREEWDATCI